jgi:hypothetical protein
LRELKKVREFIENPQQKTNHLTNEEQNSENNIPEKPKLKKNKRSNYEGRRGGY